MIKVSISRSGDEQDVFFSDALTSFLRGKGHTAAVIGAPTPTQEVPKQEPHEINDEHQQALGAASCLLRMANRALVVRG